MNVLDASIFLIMNSDVQNDGSGIKDLSTGGIYQMDAPEDMPGGKKTMPPYTIFRAAAPNDPSYTFGNHVAFNYAVYAIQGFAMDQNEGGVKTAGKIADRLFSLFLNANLSISGKNLLTCRPLKEIAPLKERDVTNDRWLYSKGWLIEIWLS